MWTTFDDFYKKEFSNLREISCDEFKKLYTHKSENYYKYIQTIQHKFEKDDIRVTDIDGYYELIWNFLLKDPKKVLELWWNAHCRYSGDLPKFNFRENIVNDNVIDGKYLAKTGRPVKNLCYKGIYEECSKPNTDAMSVLGWFKGFYLWHYTTNKQVFTKMLTSIMQRNDYDTFFAILRGTLAKNSVFNPYTYGYILNNVLPKGKNVLNPVMSWCVPIIAFHNSEYEHMVGIDVIPNTINTSKELHSWYNDNKNFLETEKQCELYLCPSEEINARHNFVEKYKDHFDTVFFSPPYYDLEMYEGGEQSWKKFKTYEEWLNGYWRKTVELCHSTTKSGSTFSFVIVPKYGSGKKTVNISDDMLNIAKEYFKFDKTMFISWGGFDTEGSNEKRVDLLEHLHIMTKE